MPERDGYIPGVPCWVDASEPDPHGAVDFYGRLFGWEFRDVMPASAEGSYFIAWRKTRGWSLFDMSGELHSGNVAAITSMPEGGVPRAMWNTPTFASGGRMRARRRASRTWSRPSTESGTTSATRQRIGA